MVSTKEKSNMAKGYWIASMDVSDVDQYKKYVTANASPFKSESKSIAANGADSARGW